MHNAAADTAQSASISTPVGATVFATASIRTSPGLGSENSTATCDRGMGWHNGRIRGVAFAARIPATRATATTSPFGTSPRRTISHAERERITLPSAAASRAVSAFPEMSAIAALPALLTPRFRPS
jgi:hypothetical protein